MRAIRPSLAALLLVAIACAHSDRVEAGDRAEGALDRGATAGLVPEATARLTDPDGHPLGGATLYSDTETWRLDVEIDSPEGTTGWRGFVVRGECDSPTGQVVELSSFAADERRVESSTVFPRAWLKPGTRYAVTVRDAEGAASACGEIGEIGAVTSATGR